MKIVIIKDNKPIDQINVNSGRVTIGRKSDCDIPVKDPAVSGLHAVIEQVKDRFVIRDENSTNGIYVKGRRVKEHILHHEDVVTVGEHRLRFLIVEQAVKKSSAAESRSAPAESKPGSATPEITRAFLTVTGGKQAGTRVDLVEGMTTIGKPGVQVAAISRRPQGHFIIHVDGGKDRERVPMVNGEPIGFKSRKLETGDVIVVAGIEMTYEFA